MAGDEFLVIVAYKDGRFVCRDCALAILGPKDESKGEVDNSRLIEAVGEGDKAVTGKPAAPLRTTRLRKGKNVLTVHILTNGDKNLAYFDFKPVH